MNATDILPTLTLAGAVLVIVTLGAIRTWLSNLITARRRARQARSARAAPRHRRRRGADPELRKAIKEWVRS